MELGDPRGSGFSSFFLVQTRTFNPVVIRFALEGRWRDTTVGMRARSHPA